MSAAAELVVQALNNAKLATKAQQKVQHMGELHELLIKNDPAMLDTFLPELIEFQVDKAASVRRRLLEFISAAVQVRCTPAVLSQVAPCTAALLEDEQLQVGRQAAIAAHGILQAGLAMHMAHPQGDAAADSAWAAVQQLQQSVSSMAASSQKDAALRIAGLKMSEQAVLLYTSAAAAQSPSAAALVTAADGLARSMCELLKEPGFMQLPGPVVICSMKALGTVALQRGHLVGKALPALLGLATKGLYRAPVPGDGLSCVAASCGAALRDMLARILRNNSDEIKPWQKRLEGALRTMGADAAADSALRHIERAAARLRASEKRKAADQGGPDAKLPRSSTPAGAESSVGNTPTRTPTPTPLLAQQQQQGDVLSMLLPGGILRSSDPTTDVQRVLEVLVEHQHQEAVETIISQISPEVLAELVLRWMPNLPAKPAAETAAGQEAAAAAPIAGPPAPAPAAAPAAAAAAAVPAPADQQELAPAAQQEQEAAAAAVLAAAAAQQQQQLQPVDPRRRAAAAGAAAAAVAAATGAPAPAVPQLPSPLPISLSVQQMQQLRQSAVQRVLGATKNRPIRNFRELLLSRLVSQAPQDDGLSELMLQHILADYHGRRGHVLVVRWLYALAAQAASTGTPAAGAVAAAAAAGCSGAAAAASPARQQKQPARAAAAEAGRVEEAADEMEVVEGQDDQEQKQQQQQPPAGEGVAGVDMQDADIAAGSGFHTQPHHRNDQRQQLDRQQQVSSTGGNSSSGSSALQDLAGTQYDSVLLAALHGLRQQLLSSDTAIPRLLQEAPVLPVNSVVKFLGELLTEGSGWETLALDAAHSLIAGRPPMRQQLLQLLLDAGVADDFSTREQAVRLLVSQLMGWPSFAPVIVQYAQEKLLLLLEPRKLMAAQQQRQQQLDGVEGHLQQQADVEQQQQVKQEDLTDEAQQRQRSPKQPNGQAEVAAGGEGLQREPPPEEQQLQQQESAEQIPQQAQQSPGSGGPARTDEQQQQQQPQPGAVKNEEAPEAVKGEEAPERVLDVEVAAQHCMLFMSVCALDPELMTVLLQAYGKAGTAARAGMDRYAASLARALGPTNPQLLALIKAPPEGSRDLLLNMLHALADGQLPPKELIDACIASFAATRDAQLLAPVTVAMPKSDVVKLLPQLVAQLSKPQLRLLYRKLAGAAAGGQPHFKPTELLVALHQIKSTQAVRVTTKQQTAALDVALHAPEVFPVAVVVQAIRRLESLSPLPQLFMRTVISALQISPKLTDTIMELLKRLITKQIWTNDKQWQGFIICCDKAAPASYPVLLQLPPNILEAALEKLHERHWRELLKYATSKECVVPVFQPVRDVLNLFLERLTNRQKAKLAAAAAAAGASGAAGAAGGSSSAAATGANKTSPAAGKAAAAKGKASAAGQKQQAKPAASRAVSKPAAAGAAASEQQQTTKAEAAAAEAAAQQSQQQLQQQQQQHENDGAEDEFMLDFDED